MGLNSSITRRSFVKMGVAASAAAAARRGASTGPAYGRASLAGECL